jgi:uncharacterized protein YceK
MKGLVLVALFGLLAGCGTINTVARDDVVTSDYLKEVRSFCGAVPRVYSGVMFDFCVLHGEGPKPGRNGYGGGNDPWWLVIDMGLSGVLDTLVLPYTIYRQHMDGSIEVVGG